MCQHWGYSYAWCVVIGDCGGGGDGGGGGGGGGGVDSCVWLE
jgi:hypothetical protein